MGIGNHRLAGSPSGATLPGQQTGRRPAALRPGGRAVPEPSDHHPPRLRLPPAGEGSSSSADRTDRADRADRAAVGGPRARPGPIRSFRDAIGAALELADDHPLASVAVLLEPDGERVDVAIARGLDASIEAVVAWAAAVDGWAGSGRLARRPLGVLLISIRSFDPDVIREADLRRFRQAGWTMARAGHRLVDWIETDGDLVRSYAHVTSPDRAWPDDPPEHRRGDRRGP